MDVWDMPFSVILSRSMEVWAHGHGDRLDADQVIRARNRGIRPSANCDNTWGDDDPTEA